MMRSGGSLLKSFKYLLVVAALALSTVSYAQIKYQFESDPYQVVTGEFTTDMRMTGQFILDPPYEPNTQLILFGPAILPAPGLSFINNSVWRFNDGIVTHSADSVDQESQVIIITDPQGWPIILLASITSGFSAAEVGGEITFASFFAGLNEEFPVHTAEVVLLECTAVTGEVCVDGIERGSAQVVSEERNGIISGAVPIPSLSALGLGLLIMGLMCVTWRSRNQFRQG